MANPPVRLLNFISEQEVSEIRKRRGERDDLESTVPDRPLYEILKENKDKQQAEFNERFKHRPPKALDEDETEFLENLETYKKEQEKQLKDEEAQQLLNFQAAIANRTIIHAPEDLRLSSHQQKEVRPQEKKTIAPRPILPSVRIKPQPKKAKLDDFSLSKQGTNNTKQTKAENSTLSKEDTCHREQANVDDSKLSEGDTKTEKNSAIISQGLVAYGTDSDEDEE